jgi:hypothetical protein
MVSGPPTLHEATGQEDRSYFGVAPMRLSTAKIQNAAAQKKTVRLFDGRGLYLEIAPTGESLD